MHAVTVGICPDSLLAMEVVITICAVLDACLCITGGLINEQAIRQSQPTFEANLSL